MSEQHSCIDRCRPIDNTSFTILQASRADIPRLSRIHVDAFAGDNAIRLYFENEDQFYDGVVSMLENQIGEDGWTHMKAVDNATKTIAAWVSWVDVKADEYLDASDKTKTANDESKKDVGQGTKNPVSFEFQPGLGTHVQQKTKAIFSSWAKGRRHYQLRGLFTDKPFQRRGIGTALVGLANEVSDRTGLPVILQASPSGSPIYAASGYEVFGNLDIDLAQWAPGAKGNDRGWGNYRFRCMTREPRSISRPLQARS